ncbi:MAG: hypothetical protein ABIS18_05195 [Actinomycetota bacterium]
MHLVMFNNEDGKSATHQTETLDEAVKFVEHIKNNEQVLEVRLYRLVEIALEVKAYFKVELAGAPDSQPPTLVTHPVEPAESNA